MTSDRVVSGTDDSRSRTGSAADLFVLLWDTLSKILGTAAAATLISRAVKRAGTSAPALAELSITTKNFTYEYRLPACWREDSTAATAAFDRVLEELVPLLTALTGHVVVRQIARLEPFSAKGLLMEEEPPR